MGNAAYPDRCVARFKPLTKTGDVDRQYRSPEPSPQVKYTVWIQIKVQKINNTSLFSNINLIIELEFK